MCHLCVLWRSHPYEEQGAPPLSSWTGVFRMWWPIMSTTIHLGWHKCSYIPSNPIYHYLHKISISFIETTTLKTALDLYIIYCNVLMMIPLWIPCLRETHFSHLTPAYTPVINKVSFTSHKDLYWSLGGWISLVAWVVSPLSCLWTELRCVS